jgi:hypothetical protein
VKKAETMGTAPQQMFTEEMEVVVAGFGLIYEADAVARSLSGSPVLLK